MAGPQLLVSVRNASEAAAALAGGADLIDIKEPTRGPLGRANPETIAAVVQAVGGKVPVSAALGELRDWAMEAPVLNGLRFVKWGLSGMLDYPWVQRIRTAAQLLSPAEPVVVAYADSDRAAAPPPAEVTAIASQSVRTTLLFDTFQKDGSSLLDWLPVQEIAALVRSSREAGVKIALAGSLTATEIDRLRGIRPDWFAVRGAACEGGRNAAVSQRRVRELAELIHSL